MSSEAAAGGVAVFLGFEIGGPDSNLLNLPLFLPHHHFLLFLVLYLPYLIGQDLHLLQSEVDLFGKLIVQVLVYRRFLVIESGFAGLVYFDGGVLRDGSSAALDHLFLHIDFPGLLWLLHDVGHGDSAEGRLLLEHSFADVFVEQ